MDRTDPSLEAKLAAPLPVPGLVPRARLLDRLSGCTRHKLTVLSAPAGSGKTTLLAQWSASPAARECDLAWISLEPADDDARRLLALVGAAIRRAARSGGAGPSSPAPRAYPSLDVALLGAAREAPPGRRLVLVLDDYHVIRSPSIHARLARALDLLPPHVHLVVACRASPPLPLARMAARGDLLEIRGPELRFTIEEAVGMLEDGAGRLPPGAAEALAARVEGWGAGLRLAIASVQGSGDAFPSPSALGDLRRRMALYLSEEVLRHESPEERAFLLRTSILERLCAPLCDAVAGAGHRRAAGRRRIARTGEVLERLERENLFVEPLDPERRWWRYHAPFAEVLRRRLEEECGAELPRLHRRAARWLEENGLPADAARHAVEAGDLDRAARLLEQAWQVGRVPTRPSQLLALVRSLPEGLLRSRPSLRLALAWALSGTGQAAAAEACLLELGRARGAAPAEAGILRAFVLALRGEARPAIRLARRALRQVGNDQPIALAFAQVSLGWAHEALGELEAARQGYLRARAMAEAPRRPGSPGVPGVGRGPGGVAPFLASIKLGELELMGGSLRNALHHYQDAAQLASWDGDGVPCAGWPQWGRGLVHYQWNDLDPDRRGRTRSPARSAVAAGAGVAAPGPPPDRLTPPPPPGAAAPRARPAAWRRGPPACARTDGGTGARPP